MNSDIAGIRNGHVVDAHLIRGGEIEDYALALPALKALKVINVICFLQGDVNDEERRFSEAGFMTFTHISLANHGFFSYDDASKIPGILSVIGAPIAMVNPKAKPGVEVGTFIHCRHGSDRTGLVVACYRIKYYGWTVEQALTEMKRYGNSWIEFGMRRAVRDFARKLEGRC